MNPGNLVAVIAAALFGTSDFLGGWAARRVSVFTVTFAAAAAGLVVLIAGLPFFPGAPTPSDFAWAVAAGACGGFGVALLYRALAIGPVSVAAPSISLVALTLPVLVALALGERPAPLALFGIALAACAIPLLAHDVARGSETQRAAGRGVLGVSIASGILVGGFLVAIGRIERSAGLMPLVVARLTSVVLFAILLAWRRQSFRPRGAERPVVASGVIDALANVGYFVAVHLGTLAIVATIVSLAPAATVLLARFVLHERWSVRQRVGLVCATAAIVCVSAGC